MPWTAVARSRVAPVNSSEVRMVGGGAAEEADAGWCGQPAVEIIGVVVGDDDAAVETGGGDDMIEPEPRDTKLVESRVLPALCLRL